MKRKLQMHKYSIHNRLGALGSNFCLVNEAPIKVNTISNYIAKGIKLIRYTYVYLEGGQILTVYYSRHTHSHTQTYKSKTTKGKRWGIRKRRKGER